MNPFLSGILCLTVALFTGQSQANDLASQTYTTYVNRTGDISLPGDYRTHWSHLGSWVVNDIKAPGYGFHDVYTQPEAVKVFLETGQIPDGTILIKKIRMIGSGAMTTGPVLWATENAVWFVMVKDTKNRFKGNSNWGEGWGWALFDAKNPKINSSKGYTQSCLSCHLPAKQTDWVYIHGYPTLRPQ